MADQTVDVIQNEQILNELQANCPDVVLPTGYVMQRTAAAIVQSKDSGKMTATFAIVTRTPQPNRYGNQLQLLPNPNGAGPVTDYYAANPVVLYDHGRSGLTLPIGLSKPGDGALAMAWSADKGIATCYFSDRPWAEPIFAAVDDGLLKMASIGFDPILAMRLKPSAPNNPDGVPPKKSVSDQVQDMTWMGLDFTEWEMLEWSVVPIGADRGALRQCLDRGHIHGVKLPTYLKQSFHQHAAEVVKLGVGMDFKTEKIQNVTIEGPMADVDSLVAEITQKKSDPKCANCGETLQCAKCTAQAAKTDDQDNPDLAPDLTMSYPVAVAQACAVQLDRVQSNAIQQSLVKGVKQAVQTAIAPVAQSVSQLATEFKRMTGKLDD